MSRSNSGKPTNALYPACYHAWYIGELVKALEGKWKPLSDEEAEALWALLRSKPEGVEDNTAWDGVSQVQQKIVTSEQFFACASEKDWALAKFLQDEVKQIARSDHSF